MKKWISEIPEAGWLFLALFAACALFASLQSLVFEYYFNPYPGSAQSNYGNYIIFKQSWFHLINGQDLYKAWPHEQFDLFKYSPAFAVFFSLFAYLPDAAGLPLWCLLNALVLFFSVKALPGFSNSHKNLILLFVALELLTSLQNSQSNALMAGLLIFSFVFLERRCYLLATLLLVLSIYLKLFGVIALALFIFYPEKWKLAFYTLFWGVVMFCLPLPFTGFDQLIFLYRSWWKLLSSDFSASLGFSVMGWLNSCFHLHIPKLIIVAAGALIGGIPLLFIKKYHYYTFRVFMLASLLIWVIIFNHKAESPTFIIAMSGAALWLFAQKISRVNLFLGIFAILFTSLSSTELFMPIRDMVTEPYVLKVVPVIFIWIKIIRDMIVYSPDQ